MCIVVRIDRGGVSKQKVNVLSARCSAVMFLHLVFKRGLTGMSLSAYLGSYCHMLS